MASRKSYQRSGGRSLMNPIRFRDRSDQAFEPEPAKKVCQVTAGPNRRMGCEHQPFGASLRARWSVMLCMTPLVSGTA